MTWQFTNDEAGSASQIVKRKDKKWLNRAYASSKGARVYKRMFLNSIKDAEKRQQVDLGEVTGAAANEVRDGEIAELQDGQEANRAELVRWQPLHTPACNSPQFT